MLLKCKYTYIYIYACRFRIKEFKMLYLNILFFTNIINLCLLNKKLFSNIIINYL